MAEFEDFSFVPEDFSGTVRLFPLPNLVLFPHVMQPLHVFEPRYCDLLRDALEGDRLIAMATLRPGWEEDYDGRPPLEPVACLGRIAAHQRLEGGQHNVLLVGLRRVRLIGELPPVKRFREAEVRIFDDRYPAADAAWQSTMLKRLREAFLDVLPALPDAQDHLDHLLATDVSLGALTDLVGYALDIGLKSKLALLAEENVHCRVELLLEHLAVTAGDDRQGNSGAIIFPPEFSVN